MKTTKRAKTATHSKSAQRAYTPTPQEIVDLYKQMLLIRRFEEHCDKAYRQDKIGGYLHLYIGQEALALGFIHHLRPEDRVLGHYRDHAYVLALGSDPRTVMAELYGKATGLCRGKGGSMHLYDKARNFLGGYGIVGDVTGIGTGVAFAQKYLETGGITLCFFGDGAMNAGLLHESLNMAGLWKLPVIYIVENNKYAMGTPVELHSALTNLAQRASVYGFPSKQIDGMDMFSMCWTRRRQLSTMCARTKSRTLWRRLCTVLWGTARQTSRTLVRTARARRSRSGASATRSRTCSSTC
jgi:pyruvate dehydrogenase E1 component alpha subunit